MARTRGTDLALAAACSMGLAFAAAPALLTAQQAKPAVAKPAASSAAVPDLGGLWDGAPGGGTRDLTKYMKSQGQTIPFTAYGAERFKKVDLKNNPNAYCLPPGPSRALTGPSPFFIVQDQRAVSFMFENHNIYRVVYLDGRGHPADIADYPQFMGHSTGSWEGDTLVVDTVGMNDRTWLDSYGLEHSDKLHLTERFQKTGPDRIKYSVTYEDPVFFTKPWTATLDFVRQPAKDRLMEYVCEDNEKDRANLVPTPREE
jgi:hypothetical protein